MAGCCTLGFASGNGAIGRVGHGAKEHAVLRILSVLDPFLLEMERIKEGRSLDRLSGAASGDGRFVVFALSLLLLHSGDAKQTFRGDAAFCARALHLVDARKIRWRDTLALAPFALISVVASAWTIWEQRFHARAVGPDWAQTFPERLIIAGKAIWFYLGKLVWPHPLIFIYPRWDVDSSKVVAYLPLLAAIAGLIALWFIRRKMGPCSVLCRRLLCRLAVSCARLFQRVFLSLLICKRSFSVSGQHGAARVGRSRDRNSSRPFL